MTASPWAPPNTSGAAPVPAGPQTAGPVGIPPAGQPGPYLQAPPPPPSRRSGPRLWPIVLAFSVIVVAAVGITALVTAAIVKSSAVAPAQTTAVPTSPASPQYSTAEKVAAKQDVCQVFDASSRAQKGQGGMLISGQPNLPVILRTVTSAVAVQDALAPAVPTDVADAAQKYVRTSLDMVVAGTGDASVDEVNRLTQVSNDATFAMADACGLPH
jgi:hypothetical protein